MPGSHNTDVIVVGLGAMGSATCAQLAARGASVIGIDQYEPPHPWGSSHGETRITRLAIGEGAEYVPLVRRSHQLWREIERRTGVPLLTETGGLYLGDPDSEFIAQTRASAAEYGIAVEDLTTAEITERFPMFTVAPPTEGCFEPTAGYVRPEAAIQSQLELAKRDGARLVLGEHVDHWEATADGVRVNSYEAGRLVLCAGPWIAELFPEGRELFAVHRQLLHWFPLRPGTYERVQSMPVYIWDLAGQQSGFVHLTGFYGFPPIDGVEGGVKVATEAYDDTTVPDGRQHPATAEQVAEMYEQFIAPRLPWIGEESLRTVSCLYTSTQNSRFVIDRHPEYDNVLIVSACSGHGFKHSAAIGEAVAQWCLGEPVEVDLSPFALERHRA